MQIRRVVIGFVAATAILFLMSSPGLAQSSTSGFPNKPVTIVLPFTTGASADIETRLYQPRLMEGLGQPVIVDYKPGAGSSIGTIYVAKAAPDGYTILYGSTGFTVYQAFFAENKLPYDTVKDFAPLSMITKRSTMLLVHPSLPVRTFPDYIAYAKSNPEKINFGTSGGGGLLHMAGAWLHSATNTRVTFIHYKGAGPMYTDLLAGRVVAGPATMFVGLPYVKSGKLIPIANMSAERSKYRPDQRTLIENGVAGYDYTSWSGYLAPARTPEGIVNRWSSEFAKIARSPDLMKRMDNEGAELVGSTPEQFRQVIVNESMRWRKVVQDNNIKLEE